MYVMCKGWTIGTDGCSDAVVAVGRHEPKLSGNGREDKEQRRGSPDAARDSGNGVLYAVGRD
jgi:hypothetical protein